MHTELVSDSIQWTSDDMTYSNWTTPDASYPLNNVCRGVLPIILTQHDALAVTATLKFAGIQTNAGTCKWSFYVNTTGSNGVVNQYVLARWNPDDNFNFTKWGQVTCTFICFQS